jgi:membrane carboxypeptidase/penicillin-binding protein
MRKALASKPAVDFPRPDTVVSVSIDPVTGLLSNENCQKKREEFYIAGTEPSEYCPGHGGTVLKLLTEPLPPSNSDGQPPERGTDETPQGGIE